MRAFLHVTAACLSFALIQAHAGSDMKTETVVEAVETPFDAGKFELQSSSGAYFSVGGSDRPTLNYSATAYRFGMMMHSPSGEGLLRGNCELMLQVLGASVFDGPGNAFGGAMVLWRYNFVQPEAKWVPYFQLGVGAIYNDIHKDRSQRLIGQAWEIDLEAAVGVRYFFSNRWSANLEGGFRHISNAGMNDRNVGLNSLGVSVGLGRHF
jgi:hypothetical protein